MVQHKCTSYIVASVLFFRKKTEKFDFFHKKTLKSDNCSLGVVLAYSQLKIRGKECFWSAVYFQPLKMLALLMVEMTISSKGFVLWHFEVIAIRNIGLNAKK